MEIVNQLQALARYLVQITLEWSFMGFVGTMSIAIICKIIYLYKNRRRHHHPQVSGQTVTGGGGRAVSVASVTTTKSEASGGREAPKTENDALRNIQKTNKDITEIKTKSCKRHTKGR